jgi:predicted Zn-dependent peptidase
LGYRRTSLFYGELRRKLGLIYSISVSNIPFKELSLFYISTSTAFSEKVLPIIKDKILNLGNYFTEEIFEEYKIQIINILKMELNDPFRINGFIKNNWVLYEKLTTPDDVISAIREASYDDIKEVINKYFNEERLFITILEKNKSNSLS